MQNLQKDLIELLKKEDNLTIEGELNKPKIIELALQLDTKLLSLLIADDKFKKHFFKEVDNILVFDKIKFQRFVSNKSFLPDSYTAFKNKIGLTINDDSVDNYINNKKEVVLAWPHKDCVLEGGQTKEDQKRDEVFWNETLAPDSIDRLLDPKAFTNFKKYEGVKNDNDEFEVKEKDVKTDELDITKENLILKGNNLLALSSLLKTHRSKVKLIYIDPPYNTGNDGFKYNDKFNHSTWLTFMKNRLEIARELLKDDGVIFVQIGDDEHAQLRLLLNEIFNDNFINHITVRVKSSAGFKTVNKGVMETSEYIYIFSKNKALVNMNNSYSETEYDKNYNLVILNPDDDFKDWKFDKIDNVAFKEVNFSKMSDNIVNIVKKELRAKFAKENPEKVFRYTAINDDAGKETIDAKKKSMISENVFQVKTSKGIRYIHNGQQITFYKIKMKEVDGKMVPSQQLTNIWQDIAWEGIANEGKVTLKKG